MKEEKQIICVVCPRGCRLTALVDDNRIVSLEGNTCNRGVRYAEQEILDPRRNLSTTVAVTGADSPVLPVKTSAPVPKGKISEVMQCCNAVRLAAPVRAGEIVVRDVCGTGADIVAIMDTQQLGSLQRTAGTASCIYQRI